MTLVALTMLAIVAGCGDGDVPVVKKEVEHVLPILDHFTMESLEENIVDGDVVARVQLNTFATAVEPVHGDPLRYVPAIVYTFIVREYLKGSGGTELVGIALDNETLYDTEAEARAGLDDLPRDSRWDDREAIVFLKNLDMIPSTSQADRYFLGFIRHVGGEDLYTVSSEYRRVWLPDAAVPPAGGGARPTATEQSFLLSAPPATSAGGGGGRSASASSSDTITLGILKTKVSGIVAEIAAGDGSEAYRRCVFAKYWGEQVTREEVAKGPLTASYTMVSGMEGGYVLYEDGQGNGIYPDTMGRYWTSGPDAGLFRIETSNPTPKRKYVSAAEPPDAIWYTRSTVTTRPLPAGVYRFGTNGLMGYRRSCNLISDYEREHGGSDNTVTVTAPSGVTHEALFDPVDLTAGVGANSTSGVLKPTAFGSDTLDRIEWESGTLKVNLTGSHAGRHIDFLDTDGELVASVAVDDAVTSGRAAHLVRAHAAVEGRRPAHGPPLLEDDGAVR